MVVVLRWIKRLRDSHRLRLRAYKKGPLSRDEALCCPHRSEGDNRKKGGRASFDPCPGPCGGTPREVLTAEPAPAGLPETSIASTCFPTPPLIQKEVFSTANYNQNFTCFWSGMKILPDRATGPMQCLQSVLWAMEHRHTNFQKQKCMSLIMGLALKFLNFKILWWLYIHAMPQLSTFGLFSGKKLISPPLEWLCLSTW